MTSHVSVLLFTILVCRRSAQQHGAAVGHDGAGDPPGDDGEEPNKGAQAQGDAPPLLKNMISTHPITDMFCLQDKKISALEEKLQPLCESGELPQTQVDFESFLRFNYLP